MWCWCCVCDLSDLSVCDVFVCHINANRQLSSAQLSSIGANLSACQSVSQAWQTVCLLVGSLVGWLACTRGYLTEAETLLWWCSTRSSTFVLLSLFQLWSENRIASWTSLLSFSSVCCQRRISTSSSSSASRPTSASIQRFSNYYHFFFSSFL